MRRAGVGSCAGCTIEVCGKFHWRPAPGSRNVHTLPFAFRPSQEDDESVKISNTTVGRSSTLTPVLPAGRRPSSALCATDYAISIVILFALSGFSEGPALSDVAKGGRRLCFKPGEACLPQARLSPSFCAPSAPKTTNFYSIQMNRSPILQLTQNEPLHFSYSMQLNAFLAPPILHLTQNKLLRHKSPHFFYSIQMNGHQSLLTDFLTR